MDRSVRATQEKCAAISPHCTVSHKVPRTDIIPSGLSFRQGVSLFDIKRRNREELNAARGRQLMKNGKSLAVRVTCEELTLNSSSMPAAPSMGAICCKAITCWRSFTAGTSVEPLFTASRTASWMKMY